MDGGSDAGSEIFSASGDSIRFTSIIRQGIADLCDKTATIKTVSKRRSISNTLKMPDEVVVRCYEEFVFSIERLVEYSREMLPEDLLQKFSRWDDAVSIPSLGKNLDEHDMKILRIGLQISEALQTVMYKKGLKDPVAPTDFDFERYLKISEEYDPESVKDEFFDPLEQGYDILGYNSRCEYSYMYTAFVTHSMNLKSSGRFDDARTFFYAALPTFAPVFDLPFLQNCIKIKKHYAPVLNGGGKGVHNVIYQLHEAEFSALMNRANILQQPDIMDTKLPENYTPASVPGGVVNK